MTYADRIRRARHRRGWTQAELADRIGVHENVTSKWELGTYTPNWQNAYALWKVLGVEPGDCVNAPPDEPRLPDDPTDEDIVEAGARLVLAVHECDGAYQGTSADELVTEHVGGDWRRWSVLIRRVKARAERMNPDVFNTQKRSAA